MRPSWGGHRAHELRMYPVGQNSICDRCGAHAPTKSAFFIRHIGLVVVFLHSHVRGRMCRRCIDSAFLTCTGITAVFGWWGIISCFITCIALPINVIQYMMALSLPRGDAPLPMSVPGGAAYGAPPSGAGYAASPGGFAYAAPAKPASSGSTGKVLLLIAALVFVPIGLCCVGFMALTAYGSVESSALAEVGEACNGRSVSTAAHYTPGGTPRVATFTQRGRDVSIDYDLISGPLETSTASNAELVLCAEPPAEELIETCPYNTPNGELRIERYRHSRRVRLVVARTGVELASEVLTGGEPDSCPMLADFFGGASTRHDGTRIESAEMVAFIERATD